MPEETPPRIEGDAVVLAGGRSARMGSDKARALLGGEMLLVRVLSRLRALFRRVHLSIDPARPYLEVDLAGGRRIPDAAGGLGPLEGVRASLEALRAPALFAAVDLAEVSLPLARVIWEEARAPGRRGAVPRWERGLEPAFAVYSPDLLADIRAALAEGRQALHGLAALQGVAVVDLTDPRTAARALPAGSPRPEELFRSLNTPAELRSLDGPWHHPSPPV